MKAKILAILLVGMLAVVAFTGCVQPEEPEPTPTPTPEEGPNPEEIPMPVDTGEGDEIPELPI